MTATAQKISRNARMIVCKGVSVLNMGCMGRKGGLSVEKQMVLVLVLEPYWPVVCSSTGGVELSD